MRKWWEIQNSVYVMPHRSNFFRQILIELETALLDDEPHWYKLQTHDVSSMPLPRASPNAQRRQLHGGSPTRRLQSKSSRPKFHQGTFPFNYLHMLSSLFRHLINIRDVPISRSDRANTFIFLSDLRLAILDESCWFLQKHLLFTFDSNCTMFQTAVAMQTRTPTNPKSV